MSLKRATRRWRTKVGVPLVLAGALVLSAVSALSAAPATASVRKAPKSVSAGILLPMSGKEAFVGQWFDHGVQAGIYAVDHAGGIMGAQYSTHLEDTAGDPVDAVTAFRTLLLYHPVVVFGPSSLEIEGVIRQFGPDHVVDLMEGGTTQLDYMNYPYVYRVFPSDSELLSGEAYYAYHAKNCRYAAEIYDSGPNAQAEVGPVTRAFTHLGGKIVASATIVAGQSSYLSAVAKLFSGKKPQCAFFHMDPQTASTFFANIRQLGHMNIPYITGDTGAAIQLAQAFGLKYAAHWMTGMAAPPAYAPANAAFLNAYQKVWHTRSPLPASPAMYDAVIIASLAMDAAHSTNPVVWRPFITKISNPPGTKCYTYPSCLALLKKHRKINYEGASGNENFNKYHNVFSSFEVEQFSASGSLHTVFVEPASKLAALY
ncbi:MAG: ABC transporter substrate-binding protein [Actinomycetota bacterium]|nr:ABC transporter substrate-binding protein [Actinomycetota bacterium]